MPAPRVHHGVRRGLEEYFTGLILAIAVKVVSNNLLTSPELLFYLNIGFWMYVIGSTGILLIKMNHWNIEYTFGVVVAGIIIVYVFREFIAPLDLVIYVGAVLYLYKKITNKFRGHEGGYYRRY